MTIDDRLDCYEENQMKILETVTELKLAVIGSQKIGVDGLINKVNKHHDYIEKDKKQKWLIAGGISVIALLLKFLGR